MHRRNNFEPDFTGAGNSASDNDGSASTSVRLRSERDGGDRTGRTYSVTVTCSNSTEGVQETVTATVIVPHDSGKGKSATKSKAK